jgi:hypothetical protein
MLVVLERKDVSIKDWFKWAWILAMRACKNQVTRTVLYPEVFLTYAFFFGTSICKVQGSVKEDYLAYPSDFFVIGR